MCPFSSVFQVTCAGKEQRTPPKGIAQCKEDHPHRSSCLMVDEDELSLIPAMQKLGFTLVVTSSTSLE